MFLAYICKRPNQGNPIAEFFLVLMMVPFQKSLSHVLPYGFIQLARSNHVVQNHIYITRTTEKSKLYTYIRSFLLHTLTLQVNQITGKKKQNLFYKKYLLKSKVIFKNLNKISKMSLNKQISNAQHVHPKYYLLPASF